MNNGKKEAGPSLAEITKALESQGTDFGQVILQKILSNDSITNKGVSRGWLTLFGIIVIVFTLTVLIGTIMVTKTINDMHATYIQETEKIIKTTSEIDAANAWERLPVNQRKERLREQYYKIIRYYTNGVPENQRMADDQILDSFNTLWLCTERIPSINFFLPLAYMKVATNFNPVYNMEYKNGIAAFYLKAAETTANLPLVQRDPIFQVYFQGIKTANNPNEMIKLLVARIDELAKTFQNREDWVILALFTNEYEVLARYWDDGKGAIPDTFYTQGFLSETLKYYYAFKNWQIPAVGTK